APSRPSSRPIPGTISARRTMKPRPSISPGRSAPAGIPPIRPWGRRWGGGGQPEGGRVRRGRSLRQQKRTQARSEECTNGEAAEREHADDEAPPEPESGTDCRKRADYPVDLRHPAMLYRALTDNQTRRMRRARPVIALAGVAFA